MTQFDAFACPVPALRRAYPLAINLRSNLFPEGGRLVIAPLVRRAQLPGVVGRLAPIVRIEGEDYVVIVDHLTSMPAEAAPARIANLHAHRESLIAAIDLLFSGY